MSPSRAVAKIPRLLTLQPHDVGDLLVAQGYLLAALWALRRRPKGELLRIAEAGPARGGSRNEQRLSDLAVAVDRVARLGLFRPTCLVRAVALERMIRRAKAGPAVVKVGVLKVANEFFAHAWIELEGRVIGDEPAHVRRFTPLDDFSALAG
jgi:hypothetical protein